MNIADSAPIQPVGARFVHRSPGIEADAGALYVAAAYSNPLRWRSRRVLFQEFRSWIESVPGVRLYVAELAYGGRPFEVTQPGNPADIQLRTVHELWHKENLLNLVIARFPASWQYGMILDGDIQFT